MKFLRISNKGQRKLDRAKDSAVSWLFYPFYLIGNFFRWLVGMIATWWGKRNLRLLLQGLPALLAFVGLVLLLAACLGQDKLALAQSYDTMSKESMFLANRLAKAKKDYKPKLLMAQTCYQRLMALNEKEAFEHRYGIAIVRGELEDPTVTDQMMRNMAPNDKTGYGRAHLYQGQKLLAQASTPGPDGKPPPQMAALLQLGEQHLLRASVWTEPGVSLAAHKLLAGLYQATNRLQAAEKHLKVVAEVEPDQKLLLADWARKAGRTEEAQRYANAAVARFQSKLRLNEDDWKSRFALVESYAILGEYPAARKLVEDGWTRTNDPELRREYQRATIRLLTLEYDAKLNDPKSSPSERYALIEMAMNIDPDDPNLLQRLLAFTNSTGPEGERSRKAFKSLVAEGKPSAMAHLFLGIDAWQKENAAEARYHWQKAFDLSRGAPLIANNLAWVMAMHPPVDLPKALDMIDSAIKKSPQDPRMHGTRGHILALLNRNEEALKDLEIAKNAYPNDLKLFTALADVTEKLGFKQQSANYRARVEELTKNPKKTGVSTPGGPAIPTSTPASGTPPEPKAEPKGEPKAEPKIEPKAAPKIEPKAPAAPKVPAKVPAKADPKTPVKAPGKAP